MAQTQETKRIKFSREVALRKNFSHRLSPGTARNEDTSGIESQVNFTFVVNAASQNRDSSDTLTPRRSAVYNDVRNWRSAFEKLADYKRRIWEIYLTCHASQYTVGTGILVHPISSGPRGEGTALVIRENICAFCFTYTDVDPWLPSTDIFASLGSFH